MQALPDDICDRLVLGLVQILKEGNPIVPSETIEFVDAVIDYIKAVDDSVGSTTASLDDLIDARNDYSGPGSGLMGNQ